MIASVGSRILGSSRSSTRMSPGAYRTAPRMRFSVLWTRSGPWGRDTGPQRPVTGMAAAADQSSGSMVIWKSLPAAAITSSPVPIVPRRAGPGCAPVHGLTRTPYSAPLDRDGEVLALALDRVHRAVELADPDDAVEERGVAVVVEDQVAAWRPVADVSGGGIVPLGRALERQLAGKRSGLLDVVVVAEGERQRQLGGEIARR